MTDRPTVAALRACKGRRQIISMHVDSAEENRLQAMRIKAFRSFMKDFESGGYPEPCHEIHVSDDSVLEALEQAGQS